MNFYDELRELVKVGEKRKFEEFEKERDEILVKCRELAKNGSTGLVVGKYDISEEVMEMLRIGGLCTIKWDDRCSCGSGMSYGCTCDGKTVSYDSWKISWAEKSNIISKR